MRMCPQHSGDATIEIPAHELLVAGGFGVHVDQAHARLGSQLLIDLLQNAIGSGKRTIGWLS